MKEKARKRTKKGRRSTASHRSCFVPDCNTGNTSCSEKRSMFRVPSDAVLLKKWELAISRTDKKLRPHNYVCELHFEERFIQRANRLIINGEEVFLPLRIIRLREGAVPTLFRIHSKKSKEKAEAPPQDTVGSSKPLLPGATKGALKCGANKSIKKVERGTMTEATHPHQAVGAVCPTAPTNANKHFSLFEDLEHPSKYWSQQLLTIEPLRISYQTAVFTGAVDHPVLLDKLVVFKMDGTGAAAACNVYLRGFLHQEKAVASRQEAQEALSYVGRVQLCPGVGELGEFESLTLQEARLRITRNHMYAVECDGSVSGITGLRCPACRQSRKLLKSRQWRATKRGKPAIDCVTVVYGFRPPTISKP
ncbi:unnamed protein product [Ixodes hexagonus]